MNVTRITGFAALVASIALSACGGAGAPTTTNPPPSQTQQADAYTGPPAATADVTAFQVNFWNNVRVQNRCGQCHNATSPAQMPNFARSDDVNLAYAQANTVVNLSQPSTSLIVTKVAGGHNCWLADAGVNVQEAMSTGQLEVHPWQDSTLRGKRFDLDVWLTSFEQLLQSASAAGYAPTNFMGHMEWALVDLPGTGDLIEYETRVNYVTPKYEGPVICTYDLTKFGASVVMDALRTHPAVIIGGLLQENPFFVPPDQFLVELRERKSARRGAIQTH